MGTPPNAQVLRSLEAGPSSLAALQSRGGVPGSTLRARLKDLVGFGAVEVRRNGALAGGSTVYELAPAGEELLFVVDVLESWLAESPDGSRPLGGEGAKAAIRALAEGWSVALLRALAVRPHSIADLDSLIGDLNYPGLERRIAAMRLAGQVSARVANGRETPYAATRWLRRGVAPLAAAIRWERACLPQGVPIGAIEIETLFLLAMPLLRLDDQLGGSCRLAVELRAESGRRLVGVLADFDAGELAYCSSRIDGRADGWASGSPGAWLAAVIEGDLDTLELGGDGYLARAVIEGLHASLFVRSEAASRTSLRVD